MRVLLVSTVEMGRHGIPSVVMNCYRLCRDSMEMDLLAHRYIDKDYKKEFIENNSKVYVYDRSRNLFLYLFKLGKILKTGNYDIIHVHGNSATMDFELGIAKIYGIRGRIAHCHNSQCDHVMLHNILKRKFKNDYTQALACSELAGDWIFGKHQFRVLNNGINVPKYRFDEETRSQKRKQFELENCFVLGHIGLFNEQKNHSKVFDVFSKLRNMIPQAKLLCVAGNSSVPEEIIQDVQERGINEDVVFLTSRNDVPELLMAMDYFILPSKWEGLGIVAIEAQASGLHCVVSESVPADIDLTDGVKHIPLQKDAKEWAEYIAEDVKDMYGEFEKCICNRIGYNKILQNSPYNIENSKLLLKRIYTREG